MLEVHPLKPLSSFEIKSLNAFSENVSILTGGEIKFSVVSFDSSIDIISKLENTSKGIYSAAFGHTHLLSAKEPASILFGAPPVTEELGFDTTTFFSWFYSAGGIDLYDELWNELDLNIKGFILQSSGPHALGWFREPFSSIDELKGNRLRDSYDFTNSVHRELGLSIVPMKSADISPELEKKNLDAVSWCCPLLDISIGIQDSLEHYYLQGISKNILNTDLYLSRNLYEKFSFSQKKAIEIAASASVIHSRSSFLYENGKALKELVEDHNVVLHDTPKEYFEEYQKVVTQFLSKKANENDFFAKVWQSQKDFALVGITYWRELQSVHKGLYGQ